MFIKKLAVTAFCAVFVFASPLLYLYRAENTIMGLPVVSREEAEKIIYSRSERQMNVNILYKGVNLPKADNIHYLSRDRNSRWKGVLTPGADNFKNLQFRVIDPEKSKEDLMSSRETLKIIAYNDTVYNISEIAVTGLPLVYIDIAGTDDTGEMYGTAKVYENDARGRKGVEGLGIYDVSIHVRGNKGDRIPKVSYKMELHNPDGGNLSASLLGMREDDDWVLNPLYTDSSRLREMLGYDIWERIGGSYTHGVEYCEFVLNYLGDCSYQGLYCLNEPVDLSTFGRIPGILFFLLQEFS